MTNSQPKLHKQNHNLHTTKMPRLGDKKTKHSYPKRHRLTQFADNNDDIPFTPTRQDKKAQDQKSARDERLKARQENSNKQGETMSNHGFLFNPFGIGSYARTPPSATNHPEDRDLDERLGSDTETDDEERKEVTALAYPIWLKSLPKSG